MPAVPAARQAKRYRVDLEARFRPLGSFQWYDARLINLSRTGLCLQCKLAIQSGARIELEIHTVDRDGEPHYRRVIADIQWRRGQRHGVKFARKPQDT